jgi:hypothetical protein
MPTPRAAAAHRPGRGRRLLAVEAGLALGVGTGVLGAQLYRTDHRALGATLMIGGGIGVAATWALMVLWPGPRRPVAQISVGPRGDGGWSVSATRSF